MGSLQKCWRIRCRQFSSTKATFSHSFEARHAWEDNLKNAKAPAPTKSFEDLGLHPPIVSALQAFPQSIKAPTRTQQLLIPAVVDGRDIFLHDSTGSGKSFGLVLALLNRTRMKQNAITSIFIVPHRDLAYQFHHWVERLFAGSSIDSIAQVLTRDSPELYLPSLSKSPPHLLFATPQALMDAWGKQPDILRLDTLSAIVVDEADYLISTVDASRRARNSPRLNKKKKQHPGETREFLNVVYGNNAQSEDDEYVDPRNRSPQLILSSATLPEHLVDYVSDESGWIGRDDWVRISGTTSSRQRTSSVVSHSVLVVSEDLVRNITGARQSSENDFRPADEGTDDPVPESVLDPALAQKYAQTPSPFNPLALETIAMILAAEVPSIALLVVPSTAPVQRAILELREVGVHAHGLDWVKARDGRPSGPTLIVSTWANTRGLDVRELSHVFVFGIPDGGPSTYVHIAGRVGRLESSAKRRRGKVVLLVAPREEEAARELLQTIKEEPVLQEIIDG
ncbi:P-loop containing nucleoside triphosphate hydrolase protein [Mycena metata]|uniref:RNA helicase n=1 Tax=Mycena metata TaxID=1033252 RepID=A0AAD7KJC5_9AGAR|nr:P-loop containing nucleoside triphosphate hydrolase protein [Mycena metata]